MGRTYYAFATSNVSFYLVRLAGIINNYTIY